jgi:demethylmenaquinone methyltransferase/2-methoxy-6-polyprenyl-1,4-benzoquinol methylase
MPDIPALKTVALNDPKAKRAFNRLHFAEAAHRYDLATRILSFGGDARWKKAMINDLPRRETYLDLACGTGDVCFLIAERNPSADIEGLDLTRAMLDVADASNVFGERIQFICGDMGTLPQADESVDVVTGSYALRNAPDLKQAILETHRVLKPGGTAAFLDFSKPPSISVQKVQYGILRFWGGLWGLLLHGNSAVHGYIAESLKLYPTRNEVDALFADAGFSKESSRLFLGGMTSLSVYVKRERSAHSG